MMLFMSLGKIRFHIHLSIYFISPALVFFEYFRELTFRNDRVPKAIVIVKVQ